MRIRVTTSINVRSNTVPSTPAQVNDEFPVLTDVKKIVEKSRSKSPLPFLTPRSNMPSSRFKESQRIPRGSRLSAWLHGFSVVNDERGRPAAHNRKASHTSTYCYSRTPRRRSQDRANGLRPVASTRGVIDPMHSPSTGAWPTNPQNQDRRDQYRLHSNYGAYQTRNLTGMGFLRPKSHHRRPRTKAMQKKGEKSCFPQVTDPKIKRKIIGCLVFGTLLTIVLTIYLALATSNSTSGATFHAVFIFFILILTIIFSHYLIRLCMLAFKPQRRFARRRRGGRNRAHWPSTDEEAGGFAQLGEPIPIVVAGDDDTSREMEEDEHEEDAESEKELPPPPPVYGNWRGSVRADPNLIHWQLHTNRPDVQQEARELIFAGSGHRPPSYRTRDEMVVVEEEVARPLPLFAERRRAAGVEGGGV